MTHKTVQKALCRITVKPLAHALALFLLLSIASSAEVLRVAIDDAIQPVTAEYVARALQQAAANHDQAVLIEINTPGGLVDSTREIIEKIVASPVPVIIYVTPSGSRAASAGFFILEAADVAVMAPGTNTGAASPVLMGEQMDPVMRSKVENDASAWLRSIVLKRGHNTELAEKTIREAKAFTEKEALDDHLIDLIAPDEHHLMDQLDGRVITRFDGRTQTLHTRDAEI